MSTCASLSNRGMVLSNNFANDVDYVFLLKFVLVLIGGIFAPLRIIRSSHQSFEGDENFTEEGEPIE